MKLKQYKVSANLKTALTTSHHPMAKRFKLLNGKYVIRNGHALLYKVLSQYLAGRTEETQKCVTMAKIQIRSL